jgi:hypothetical protein
MNSVLFSEIERKDAQLTEIFKIFSDTLQPSQIETIKEKLSVFLEA